MIAVDTNILLRLFTTDDSRQTEAARHLVGERLGAGETVFVGSIVLAELVWTLRRRYARSKRDIVTIIETLLADDAFVLEQSERVETALLAWRSGRADFADYMIALAARDVGCVTTYTFDTNAAASPTFTLVPA